MKQLFYLVLSIIFLSCNPSGKAPAKEETKMKESKYRNLLSKYKEKAFDTLKVYSPDDLEGEYGGVALDSTDAILFPEDIARRDFSDPPSLFAVYRFAIDSNRIGLITRTPSDYVPSSVKLFFYDKTKDTITSYIELAESWGDEGSYFTIDSWLYKSKGQAIQAFIRRIDGYDNSLDNEKDTTVEEWDNYSLLDLSKQKIDTISTDKKMLVKKFSNLIKK